MLENHWYIAAAGPRLCRKPRAARVLDRRIVELAGEGRWEEERDSLPARRVLEIHA